MKHCPLCLVAYSDDTTSCPRDGARLVDPQGWEPGAIVCKKYRIVAQIGRGGMGTVYKAEHTVLEEIRALKVMDPQLGRDPKFIRRFQQEAKLARRIKHPNVVHVDDFEQAEDGSLFIAMEYVDGASIRQLLKASHEPLPVARALAIAKGVTAGLSVLHEAGLVHRDVKPGNILLATDAQGRDLAKLADFGIVALTEIATFTSSIPLMTPAYTAPEQWRGIPSAELDGRTDIYALGVTLYEMLTGRLPFDAQTPEQWMHAHLEQEMPPPSRFHPRLGAFPGLDPFVLRLMAKDRGRRPASTADLLGELIELDSKLSAAIDDLTLPMRGRSGEPHPAGRKSFPVISARPIDMVAESPPAEVMAGVSEGSRKAPIVGSRRRWHSTLRSRRVMVGLSLLSIAALLATAAVYLKNRLPTSPAATQSPVSSASPTSDTPATSAPAPEAGEPAERSRPKGAVGKTGSQALSPTAPTLPVGNRTSDAPAPGQQERTRPDRDDRKAKQLTRDLDNASDLFERGQYDAAISAYEMILHAHPDNADAKAALARVRKAKSTEEEVLKRLKRSG